MPAIERDQMTGQMIRRRAIHGSAKDRDRWHAHHEAQMERVEREAEHYLGALVGWIAILNKQIVLAIVGWYAQEHGLSFWEALHRLFSRGDASFVQTCQQFGKLKGHKP